MEITLTDILSKVSEKILKIIGIIIFLGISIYILYLASTDPKTLIQRPYLYTIGVIAPLLFAFFLLLGGKLTSQTLYIIIGLLGLVVLIYIYISTDISKNVIIGYLINICVFFIIFIGLMLSANLIMNNLKRNKGWIGFITNLIFYIPCLVNDFIGYVLKDFYSTPQIFFTLFVIEICLILLFIYAMPLLQSYIKGDGVIIQSDAVFLNQLTSLDSGEVRTITTNTMTVDIDISGNKIFKDGGNNNMTNVRSNFSISMWVFLNPPNTSRIPVGSESNIFYYGSTYVPSTLLDGIPNDPENLPTAKSLDITASGTSFHPQITYAIDTSYNGYYKIYVDSQKQVDPISGIPEPIMIDTDIMPYQKWNNIVFTYNENMVDIFINGVLVRSKELSVNPMFSNYDIMAIGTDSSSLYATTYKNTDTDLYGPTQAPTNTSALNTTSRNGLYGAVCNVMYYPTPLDRGKIATNYNYLVVKNMPIF